MPAAGALPPGSVFLAKPYPLDVLVHQVVALANQAAAPTVIAAEAAPPADKVVPFKARDG
jgi:hypothetical protein